jgi:hypothetical protein
MQKSLFASGAIVLILGFALQYGPWLMAWISRLGGWHTPAATYEEFVDRIAGAMTHGHAFARIALPWGLMVLGVMLLMASRRFGEPRS